MRRLFSWLSGRIVIACLLGCNAIVGTEPIDYFDPSDPADNPDEEPGLKRDVDPQNDAGLPDGDADASDGDADASDGDADASDGDLDFEDGPSDGGFGHD